MLSIIKPLLVNITILFSLTFNANLFFPFNSKQKASVKQRVIYGLISAFGALLCMAYPIETLGETYFDLRMVFVLIVTLYSGWLSGGIVIIVTCLARYLIGGAFFPVGIVITLGAYLIGLLFRRYFIQSEVRYLSGSIVVGAYFLIYILIIYTNINFLEFNFYLVYFLAFYLSYLSMIFIIESLIKTNKQFDEMLYVDKLRTIGQMAASIAHEIRNPITTVRGFIQYIQQDTKDENLKKFAPLILDELDRTNKIITDYLKLNKPYNHELTKIDIDQVLKDSIELLKPLGFYSNVTLLYHSEDKSAVYGDIQLLKQSLMNVIKNGIESMEHGGEIHISKKTNYLNGTVVIEIVDSGKGMTEEELENLGLPFYTTKSKGTGLGSMITNRLIREMDGTVAYKSKIGKGTSVMITLHLVQ
ncbi:MULTISPECIES: ATP-binding protein [Bacillaceae]|uniref:ATP-binding protein n=1 Tax=Bacillaceae TaxID=186817 RepID=UPI000C78506D|nr:MULTISPECIES: ATP-binding protein [Bacillaceae]PLR69475.1 two-component sensor histidine kinase [Bacillus sp. UMB0893]QNG59052.1 two-component sensor histidine kinase [Bacillus sp. PAMC26568]